MAKVSDGQSSFLGGMRDNVSPELLADSEYAFAENIELRNGRPETRRGSFRVLEDNGTAPLLGAGIFQSFVENEEFIMLAQNDLIFRVGRTGIRTAMTPPDTLGGGEVRFLQALDRLYVFRGENLGVFRWSGDIDEDIEFVPEAVLKSSMPGSDRVLFAYNRFWVITGTDTLNASDLLSEEFDLIFNSFNVSQGDGQRLIAVQPFGAGKLIAFKERSIAIISNANNFTTASDLTLEFIDDEVGCDSKDSIVNVGKDILFKSSRGVYSLIQTSEQNAQLIDIPLSEPIEALFQRISTVNAPSAQGVLFDNYYLLAVPFDGASNPGGILAFDLELKRWAGLWRITDNATTDDDGLFKLNRLLVKDKPKSKLIAVNNLGAVAELLRGRHEDLRQIEEFAFDIREAARGRIVVDGTTLTAIGGQTAGQIEVTFEAKAVFSGDTLFSMTSAADSISIRILSITNLSAPPPFNQRVGRRIFVRHGTGWEFYSASGIEDDRRYRIAVVHDGTAPRLFIDGIEEPIFFQSSADKTKWIAALGTLLTTQIGTNTGVGSLDSRVFGFAFLGLTGWDSIVAHFPLNEGTGTTPAGYEIVSGKSVATFGSNFASSPTYDPWIAKTADSAISTQLTTRGYSFQSLQLYKQTVRGLLKTVHMDPNLTITVINNEDFDNEAVLSALTFDEVKYEVHSQADWVNTNVNDDFGTPFRERYAPLNFPSGGLTIGANGVTLSLDRERSQFIRSDAIAKWFQLDIQSTRDMIGVVAVVLDAESRQLATLRAV